MEMYAQQQISKTDGATNTSATKYSSARLESMQLLLNVFPENISYSTHHIRYGSGYGYGSDKIQYGQTYVIFLKSSLSCSSLKFYKKAYHSIPLLLSLCSSLKKKLTIHS